MGRVSAPAEGADELTSSRAQLQCRSKAASRPVDTDLRMSESESLSALCARLGSRASDGRSLGRARRLGGKREASMAPQPLPSLDTLQIELISQSPGR